MVFLGFRFHLRVIGHGMLHCQRCGGDRLYQECAGRRWLQLLCIPVIPLDRVTEHVQCTICGTRYRSEILRVPTTAQMQVALPLATRAAAAAMLRAGDEHSCPARACAVEAIRRAGQDDYGDAALGTDLADGEGAGDLAARLRTLALQLTVPSHEWFLAAIVRVGLADGQLSAEERGAARQIAAHLGMTPAQARGVISMMEEAAAAG